MIVKGRRVALKPRKVGDWVVGVVQREKGKAVKWLVAAPWLVNEGPPGKGGGVPEGSLSASHSPKCPSYRTAARRETTVQVDWPLPPDYPLNNAELVDYPLLAAHISKASARP